MVIRPASMPAGTQRGFTYIGLLLALALVAAGLSAAGVVWHTETQRAQEAELLFIGGEFKRAIAGFYDGTPGPVKQLPKNLEDLLHDTRYPTVRRYLRKIYVDPISGRAEWGLVATPAGITGVYSLSQREPFKNRGAPSVPSVPGTPSVSSATSTSSARSTPPAATIESDAKRTTKYSDWKFVAGFEQPLAPTAAVAPGAPVPAPQPGAQDSFPETATQANPQVPRPEPSTDLSRK
jgi:type II secretory pathway pseudopilin PulG